jgi:hypothetical protein
MVKFYVTVSSVVSKHLAITHAPNAPDDATLFGITLTTNFILELKNLKSFPAFVIKATTAYLPSFTHIASFE